MRLPYPLLCALVGLVVGWFPILFHGPIPEKFNLFYLNGQLAVWAFYASRLLVGLLVGITAWPPSWWMRGALIGVLVMLPPGFFALATPGCGPT